MNEWRRRGRSKEWASKRAVELRRTVEALRYRSSGGSYASAARKGAQIRRLEEEALRLERFAAPPREPVDYEALPF